jgi:hypothetical protein
MTPEGKPAGEPAEDPALVGFLVLLNVLEELGFVTAADPFTETFDSITDPLSEGSLVAV